MIKKSDVSKNSKLKLFNDFHLIKNKIVDVDENGNNILLCVDCSDKKRSGSVGLNLGIAYANDDVDTCVYIDEQESNLATQLASSKDKTSDGKIETQIKNLSIQSIQLVEKDGFSSLIELEKMLHAMSDSFDQNILPINGADLSDEALSEMMLAVDQVVVVVSQLDTRWAQINRVIGVAQAQNKEILGYIWID
ncbi:hypothetical protein N692_05485 [Lactiplantibacillus plantarum EGD-AQ4]|nr:hypothetical protein N692_05485 [Lactiplantibacillus plantarum EGD-AQ4]